jgi:hypothetical protein
LLEHRDVYWKDALWFVCIGFLLSQFMNWAARKWDKH